MEAWNQQNQKQNVVNQVPKIAICIPYNSSWNPEWVDRTYAPLRYTPLDWCVKITFLCKVPSLPVARDTLINQSLEQNCDYTFFIDTDVVFESDDPNVALRKLYQCMNKVKEMKNAKIVSGLYRAKQKVGFNYAMWMKAPGQKIGFVPIEKWTGNWLEVSVCGLGCCLIDNHIFRETPKPWFKWDTSEGPSEDFYFFELAKKHGFETHVFTEVRLSHLGNLKVKCDGTMTVQDF
jgi:hypothetical protein